MKKSEIRVTIDDTPKQQRAIEILKRYGQRIWDYKYAMNFDSEQKHLCLDLDGVTKDWWIQDDVCIQWKNRTEITLDELEEILKSEK